MMKNILEGKKLPVYGKGDNVRDWLYVEDHCKGIDLVLRNAKVGEVYNIGGFNEEKNINIVKLVIDILKEEITNNDEYKKVLKTDLSNINYNLITYVQDRLGHDMRYAIDPSKIAKDLGWYPETDFEIGIRKTVKWYLEHQDWVNEVVSGDYQKFIEIDGRRYSHIINPITGYPSSGITSVTIIGDNAEIANGISTSIMVLGKKKGLEFAKKFPNYQYFIIEDNGNIIQSKGFGKK